MSQLVALLGRPATRTLASALTIGIGLGITGRASAQPATSGAAAGTALGAPAATTPATGPDVDKADRLFAEGKALLGSNLVEACHRFDDSLAANPAALGTLLNVALCNEKLGKVTTAVLRFAEARDRALEQGLTDYLHAAEQHLTTLAPDVPHLAISLSESLPGTQVLIDDRVIARDTLGNVAVDPGERVLVVNAPARLPYRAVLVVAKGEHQTVVIPALASSIVVTSSGRRIGQIATVVGGAAVATGLGLGLYAHHLYREQFGHTTPGDGLCNAMNECEPAGQARTQRARTLGNVGTAVGVVGVALAGAGAYLWYRSPASTPGDTADDKRFTLAPELGADHVGVVAAGRF